MKHPAIDEMTRPPAVADGVGKLSVGWREWVALPDLGIERIKAKFDTGARTSVLDVARYEVFSAKEQYMVRFDLCYGTGTKPRTRQCVAPLRDIRQVRDSGGHVQDRVVIYTRVTVGRATRRIEVNLSRRLDMKFRMLIGRSAMAGVLVDPSVSYLAGPPTGE